MAELRKVVAGDEILAVDHNNMVDEIKSRITSEEAETITNAKIQEIIGAAPENLDTLEEIAAALAANAGVVETLEGAITSKADKVKTETDITALQTAMATSDKHESVTFDAATNSLVITYKDGTKATTAIPSSKAVYS